MNTMLHNNNINTYDGLLLLSQHLVYQASHDTKNHSKEAQCVLLNTFMQELRYIQVMLAKQEGHDGSGQLTSDPLTY